MEMYKAGNMKKYKDVWKIRTGCHRRWMDCAKARIKEKGGTLSQCNIASQRLRFIQIDL